MVQFPYKGTYPVQLSFMCNLCNHQLRPQDLDLTSEVFFHLHTHGLDLNPQVEGFKWKKSQTLDLDPVALIDGCIYCTRRWVAYDTF